MLRAILHGPVVVVVTDVAAMAVVAASAVVVVAGRRRTMRHTVDIGRENIVWFAVYFTSCGRLSCIMCFYDTDAAVMDDDGDDDE
jgi:hypothetical protein